MGLCPCYRKYLFLHRSHWTWKALTAVLRNSISILCYCLATILQLCDKSWNIYSLGISSPTGSTWHYAGATVVTFLCHPYFKNTLKALQKRSRMWKKITPSKIDLIKLQRRYVEKDSSLKTRVVFGANIVSWMLNPLLNLVCLVWWYSIKVQCETNVSESRCLYLSPLGEICLGQRGLLIHLCWLAASMNPRANHPPCRKALDPWLRLHF